MDQQNNRQARTTEDLIAELDGDSTKFMSLAIAVGFPRQRKAEFVHSEDENRLERLNRLMSEGGIPVGLVGLTKTSECSSSAIRVHSYVYPEWEAEIEMQSYACYIAKHLTKWLEARSLSEWMKAQTS